MSQLRVCVLGAINGLLVGIAVEVLRSQYVKLSGYYMDPLSHDQIPFICVVAFTAVSHIVHRYFTHHPQLLLPLWLLLSVAAVSVGSYMSGLKQDGLFYVYILAFALICCLLHRYWVKYPFSSHLLWPVIGTSTVLIVAAVVQIIGLFMTQKHELRQPLTWLLCLVVVLVLSSIYGAAVQHLSPYPRNEFNVR